MKEKALFISNRKFLDPAFPEGGVKFCTDEYLALLKERFDVITFGIDYTKSLIYRIRKKAALAAYEDYDTASYAKALNSKIVEENIRHVFLNLSNTASFGKLIRSICPSAKIILCSHGNESGDYLHDIVEHQKYSGLKKRFATFSLGRMLVKECEQRKDLDLVLTVSAVEENLEKWLGAKEVYMVPRVIAKADPINEPRKGRVGLLSDLSHEPNYYGISKICECLTAENTEGIELRLVGSGKRRGYELAAKYKFVKYIGHLPEDKLALETGTWTFALNPVLYYSRGVSTKLGKNLGEGIPVITTDKGLRGYQWKEGEIPVCKNEKEIAQAIIENAVSPDKYFYYREEVKKIQRSSPLLSEIMDQVSAFV